MVGTWSQRLLFTVPWGELPLGLPPAFQDFPLYSEVDPAQVRRQRTPMKVRLDSSGGFHLTGGTDGVLHCLPDGRISGATPFPPTLGNLVDFAVDGFRVLLDQPRQDPAVTRLSVLSTVDEPVWATTGSFAKVLCDGGLLYAPERYNALVHVFDLATGRVSRVLKRGADSGRLFLANGQLCAVYSDLDRGKRGVELMTPDGEVHRHELDHFAWLVHPIGFDGDFNVYAWRDGRAARISLRGQLEPIDVPGATPQWQVDVSGRLFYTVPTDDGLQLMDVRRG